jgi:small-conductance mechanosensitive channel
MSMENLSEWWSAFSGSLSASLGSVGEYLPILAAAVVVMLLGWLAARLARGALIRSGGALNRFVERLGRPMQVYRLRVSPRLVVLVANLLFWIIILLFAAIAARVAGLDTFSVWLNRIVDYVPTLVAGLLIVFVGYLFSTLVRDIARATFDSVGATERELAGLAAQLAVLVTALVIGLDQIGIDVTFLIILAAVLLGGILLSMALAFGIGAREYIANLVARHQLRGTLETGDRVRLDGVEGRVLEVTPTAIVLINEEGRFLVPASVVQRQTAAILSVGNDD